MKYLVRSDAVLTDAVVLLVRLCVGVVFIAHGWDKVTGEGVAAIVASNRELGIPLPELSGPFLAYGELVGGALLVLGVATRAGAAALTAIMIGAWVFVHSGSGLMQQNGGFEYVMVLAAVSLLILAYGPGRFSLDAALAELFGGSDAKRAARTGGGADRRAAAGR